MELLEGYKAIVYAVNHRPKLTLNKYSDSTEGARKGISVEEATDIAKVDPTLIWISIVR